MSKLEPSAARVAEVLCRPIDPWDPATAAALEADSCELRNHCGKYCTEVHPGRPYESQEYHPS